MLRLTAVALIATIAFVGILHGQDIRPEEFRPEWKVGQKWKIETVSVQTQARRDPVPNAASKPVRWQFEVDAIERIEGRDCFRIVLRCCEPGEQPMTTLWVAKDSLTLLQLRMQLPGPDGFSTVTEFYRSNSGQPFPAVSALTVPPLDLPLFLGEAKGPTSFEYRASLTPEGVKDVGELDFSVSIKQEFDKPNEEDIQQLLPEQFAKSVENNPVIEVRLKTGRSQVRQLWQKGFPWPVYSSNGIAISRLIQEEDSPATPNARGAP